MQYAKQPDYMAILKLDDEELQRRLAFYELREEDFNRLTVCLPNSISARTGATLR